MDLFKSVPDIDTRFSSLDKPASPTAAKPFSAMIAGFGVSQTVEVAKSKAADKHIKKLIGKEVSKQLKRRQPKGLNFDLF